nr:flavin reductase family protein [Phytoactinopolyspora alkaliphila]
MLIDPSAALPQTTRRLLFGSVNPRPIAWTSTISASGIRNLAPFSFFTVVSTAPPMVSITIERHDDGREKDSLLNIRSTGEFAVNVVTAGMAAQMCTTSAEHPSEVDEFDLAGVAARPAHRIGAPLVADAPISLECELERIIQPGGDAVVIGRVVLWHVDAAIVDGEHHVDVLRWQPMGRVGASFSPVERIIDSLGEFASPAVAAHDDVPAVIG